MPVRTQDYIIATPPGLDQTRQRFASLAWVTAMFSYLLVVFGGIVRITGSGLGCGDDWPLCNGHILPPWDLPTWIEWTHRLLAAGLSVLIVLVALWAFQRRDHAGFGGRGGAMRPALLALALLVFQVALGAITVKLDLPAAVTSVHFINALLLTAALVVASVRARGGELDGAEWVTAKKLARSATAALVLGFVVVVFGAFTANFGMQGAQAAPSAAAWACQGFPLCNGQFMPKGDAAGLVHTHWSHRMVAYLLFFHLIGATIAVFRRGAASGVKRAALASVVLVVMQITVAAAMVLHHLPSSMRVMHLVVGAALWMALVLWATRARQQLSQLDLRPGR
jgi:heme A synthase